MVNLEHKLTIDDLIVEYMMYKVRNGYEPSFLTSEFINFLDFFESKMHVEDSLYEPEKLFKRFFERKAKNDWSRSVDYAQKEVIPHMDMVYSETYNEYLIKANYKLSDFDRSIINTYFMDNGMSRFDDYKGETFKIRKIIGEYLQNQEKRKIDENIEVEKNDLIIGQYVAAEIIINIWKSYIKGLVERHRWPEQCSDMNKYLLEVDLAEVIGVESIRSTLFELYIVLSKRIAVLYHQDKNLQISTHAHSYLARANYELLIRDYEKIMNSVFGSYKKSFDVDLSNLTFTKRYEVDGTYYWDESSDIKVTTNKIGTDNVKKLVRNLNNIKF